MYSKLIPIWKIIGNTCMQIPIYTINTDQHNNNTGDLKEVI